MGIFSKFGQKASEESEARRERVDEMIAAGKAKEGSLRLDEMEADQKVKSAFKEKEREAESGDMAESADYSEHPDAEPSAQPEQQDLPEQPESADDSSRREANDVPEEEQSEEQTEDEPEEPAGPEEPDSVPADLRMSLAGKFIEAAAKILFGEAMPDDYQNLADMIAAREAVEAAYAEGELQGRNAQIEEMLVERSVGVPDLGGAPVNTSRRAGNSIFDLAVLAR